MVRRFPRALIAGFVLAIVFLCGWAIAGSCGCNTVSAQNPVAHQQPQHNIAVQLKPTGENHNHPVITALAIDPRGELLAVSGDDHVIRVLRRTDFALVTELRGHEDWVQSLDFAPDGSLLVSVANDGQLISWGRDDGWTRQVSMQDLPALRAVRFSPLGRTVATVGFSQRLYMLNIDDDKRPTLTCGCRDLRTLAYRGDGLMLAAAGRSGDVFLFDAVTGSTIADVKLSRQRIREICYVGQTSLIVTASEDGHAVIYDTEARKVLHDLHIPGCKLLAACLINDTHVALGGSDNIIRIFAIDSGQLVQQLHGHSGSVASLQSIDNVLYSGSFDTTVRRWNLTGMLSGATVAEGHDAGEPLIRTSRLP